MIVEVERDFIESKIELIEDLLIDFDLVLHNWENDGDEMREYNEDIYKYYKDDKEFKFELIDLCEYAYISEMFGVTKERIEKAIIRLKNDLINLKGRL